MTESEHHGWRGQIAAMHQLAIRHDSTLLGVPAFRRSSGRVTDPSRP